jgi:hypothetical protein
VLYRPPKIYPPTHFGFSLFFKKSLLFSPRLALLESRSSYLCLPSTTVSLTPCKEHHMEGLILPVVRWGQGPPSTGQACELGSEPGDGSCSGSAVDPPHSTMSWWPFSLCHYRLSSQDFRGISNPPEGQVEPLEACLPHIWDPRSGQGLRSCAVPACPGTSERLSQLNSVWAPQVCGNVRVQVGAMSWPPSPPGRGGRVRRCQAFLLPTSDLSLPAASGRQCPKRSTHSLHHNLLQPS